MTELSARPVAPSSPPRRRHVPWVSLLTVAAAALYGTFSLQQHRHLRTSSYDSVIFDQAVRAYAHFRLPVVPVKGVHNELGSSFVLLGDHFSPVLALLAPVYWIWDDVPAMLLAQAVLFASSVPLVWVFVRRLLGPATAYLVATAYALSWGFASALATDFHEVAFAVPLVALALERAQARRPGQAALAALALLAVKEDFGPFVAFFGVYLAVLGWRRLGTGLAAGGIAGFYLTTQVLIPHFGGHGFAYWSYGALGPDLPSALGHVVRHPVDTLQLATHPEVKQRTLRWLFLPWGLLPLVSPIGLLAIPLLAERLFSSNWHYWLTAFHYSAVLMPILAMGAADGLARLLRRATGFGRRPRWMIAVIAGTAALGTSLVAIPEFAFGAALDRDWWSATPTIHAASAITARVPDGVTIEADSRLGPHLTRRTHVLLLDQKPRGAPWVLIDVGDRYFPFDDVSQARDRYALLTATGYRLVATAGGFRLLHR
ncbi:MAG: DUF2079 domain-containing protein [Frankiaceae bacterium]